MNEDDLLDEFPLGYDPDAPRNIDEPFFACEIGERLWREYRAAHPAAPERPTSAPEDDPDVAGASAAYWEHVGDCGKCNEI